MRNKKSYSSSKNPNTIIEIALNSNLFTALPQFLTGLEGNIGNTNKHKPHFMWFFFN